MAQKIEITVLRGAHSSVPDELPLSCRMRLRAEGLGFIEFRA